MTSNIMNISSHQILKDGACEVCPEGAFVKNNVCKYCKEGLYRLGDACVGTEQQPQIMKSLHRDTLHSCKKRQIIFNRCF